MDFKDCNSHKCPGISNLTNSMVLGHSWEANDCSTSQVLWLTWNLKFHDWVHKVPPLVPILNQISPVHTPSNHVSLKFILIFFTNLCLGLPCGHFPSGLLTKILYTFLICHICSTFLAHIILLDFINLMILCHEWKPWSSSLCSFHQPLVTSSLFPLRPKYSLQHPFLIHLQSNVSPSLLC
jgi:hypothetical protein